MALPSGELPGAEHVELDPAGDCETADSITSVTCLAVQPDARLRERLNWDGSLPFECLPRRAALHDAGR
jgi:hypothetical protein